MIITIQIEEIKINRKKKMLEALSEQRNENDQLRKVYRTFNERLY